MEAVRHLPGGAYNFGSETTKSMFEITTDFLALLGKNIPIEDVSPQGNLWINCEKARKFGVIFSTVEDGFKKCAKDYGYLP
jgi:dTDP-4-dehydrorhamnose reductase